MENSITLASAIYEKDYRMILNPLYGGKHFAIHNDLFSNRIIVVNNINDWYSSGQKILEEVKEDLKLTDVYVSLQCAKEVLRKDWNVARDSFYRKDFSIMNALRYLKNYKKLPKIKGYDGYWYSIAPMIAIAKCKTRWLLYLTGDTQLTQFSWVKKAIKLMEEDSNIFIANPVWIERYYMSDKRKTENEWIVSDVFSDQCFLVDVVRLRLIKGVLNEKNCKAEIIYPYYGGNCFERRLGAYMMNHNLKRIVNTKEFYSCRPL